jgi:hypothetical protein
MSDPELSDSIGYSVRRVTGEELEAVVKALVDRGISREDAALSVNASYYAVIEDYGNGRTGYSGKVILEVASYAPVFYTAFIEHYDGVGLMALKRGHELFNLSE